MDQIRSRRIHRARSPGTRPSLATRSSMPTPPISLIRTPALLRRATEPIPKHHSVAIRPRGKPLSDKSAVVAGLLQLFLGGLGIGRFYIGSTSIGAVQLCLGLFGFFFSWFFIGIPVLLGVGIWAFVDAIIMFTGGVKDNYGRKLR